MTEGEAEKRRCCGPEGCGMEIDGLRWCIGSECMGWRWAVFNKSGGAPFQVTSIETAVLHAGDSGKYYAGGFCGLAGRPA